MAARVRGLPDLTGPLPAASWASGRPKTAQQTSRRPLVQTSSSGALDSVEAGQAGPHAVEVTSARAAKSMSCNASGASTCPVSSQVRPWTADAIATNGP